MPGLNPADRNAVEKLYERTIDFGGHPNQLGLFGSLTMVETPEALHFDTTYLMGGSDGMHLALRTAAQIGVASLGLMGYVFDTRFKLLGLWAALTPIKSGL